MLQNEYLVAIVAVHTAENEPLKVWGWFHSFFNPLLNTYPNTYTLRCAARSAAICAASYAAFCRSNTSPHRDAARKASMFLLARASLVISSHYFLPSLSQRSNNKKKFLITLRYSSGVWLLCAQTTWRRWNVSVASLVIFVCKWICLQHASLKVDLPLSGADRLGARPAVAGEAGRDRRLGSASEKLTRMRSCLLKIWNLYQNFSKWEATFRKNKSRSAVDTVVVWTYLDSSLQVCVCTTQNWISPK
jgi:hypothetical protein